MGWFTRTKEGITTSTLEKKETPEGLWFKCPTCKKVVTMDDLAANAFVCAGCGYHQRIGVRDYFSILFDENQYEELFGNLFPADPLNFTDTKKYSERLKASIKKTGNNDAVLISEGKIEGNEVVIGCMDFNFIGGSMGSVVGEKISLAIDRCIEKHIPLLIISKSGGARMMEAGFSLMQMAKTSGKLTLLAKAKLPYFSLLTDPTTGGVTASFGMLGDLNLAEPGALIGF
ncbi:MAG: acetyl-CoA carboxylase carboxyl transferase subunit beta, partial [Bacteroidetes bacterium]|nr:acetyl-CoA carboxylase carboxyl transferase subunit beta [Bacteroidota bacterium]